MEALLGPISQSLIKQIGIVLYNRGYETVVLFHSGQDGPGAVRL